MPTKRADRLTGGALFVAALCVFWWSPVTQMTDSKFALLVSHSLWHNHSFTLDTYPLPRADVGAHGAGVLYQLHEVKGHVYYLLPPGTSVLSVPYLVAAEAFGYSVTNTDGTPDAVREEFLQARLAGLLMALLAVILFATARLLLPRGLSVTVALGGVLGTQVWSTASRALWAHTWDTLLWGLVAWLLLAAAVRGRRPHPLALATLLAWTYFVRPTSALGIIAVTIYVFRHYRASIIPYAVTGAAWAGLFGVWSWQHFGTLLPEYYQAGRLDFSVFGTALAGHLFSPSRGLLIYVPVLWFVGYLLARYRQTLPHKSLAYLSGAVIAGQLFSVAAYPHWWGGNSFGPRFLTDLAAWFVLLAILGLAARTGRGKRWEIIAGVVLLALSVFINGRGALSWDTWRWNSQPQDINKATWRLWDWRQPQFLAGLVRPPLPPVLPQLPTPARIDFTKADATPFLWYGWSGPDDAARWSDGTEAEIIFACPAPVSGKLSINLAPFLVPERLEMQPVTLELNGQTIGTLELTSGEMATYEFPVEPGTRNVLRLKIPRAAAPAAFSDTPNEGDQRLLGVRVAWLEIR